MKRIPYCCGLFVEFLVLYKLVLLTLGLASVDEKCPKKRRLCSASSGDGICDCPLQQIEVKTIVWKAKNKI